MKKFPRVLCCLIFVLVFAVVILPAIKDDFAVGKSYAAENASNEPVYYDTFVFDVYGYGHGVGMSQDGAVQMAANGDTYDKILTHYYPGTSVKTDNATPVTVKYGDNDILLVEYLCKAAKREMGYANGEKEALKAQMAAIYTFAKHYNFDVSKSTHAYDGNFEYKGTVIYEACLEYLGMETNEDTPVAKYVDYNGEAAYTCYFSNSAGKTASAQSVWGTDKYPYLKGCVSSPEKVHLSTTEIRATEMKKLIESYAKDIDISITLSENPAEWLEIISYDVIAYKESGYVDKIRVGDITVSGNTFRNNILNFKIKSHCFDLVYMPAEETTTKPTETEPVSTTLKYPATTSEHSDTTVVYPTYNDSETTTKANPKEVVGIYVPDMTVIKETRGDWASQHSEECPDSYCTHRYFHYDVYPRELTVAFRDGTHFTGSVDEVTELTCTAFGYQNNQYYETQWSSGNSYYVTCWLGRASTTYKVSVIDTPVESVEVEFDSTQFVEKIHGHPEYTVDKNGEIIYSYFHYDIMYSQIDVTFKEGYEYYEDYGYTYDISDDQSAENPWGVGKHTVTLSVLGYTEDFEIEVVPIKEIKNISVAACRKVVENIDGYTEHDIINETTGEYLKADYFHYYVDSPIITVEFADGTVVSGDRWDIISHFAPDWDHMYCPVEFEDLQSYKNQWKVGKNTAYAIIFGQVIPFEVEVIPCPFSKIEFIKAPDKTEYIVGEFASTEGAVVRISYKDGDYIDVPLVYNGYYFETYYYDSKLEQKQELHFGSNQLVEAGTDKIVVSLSDKFICECPVTVKENLIESISIHNSENNDLIITAYNSDGTTEEMKVLKLWGDDGGSDLETEMHTGGWLFTDKGIFMGYFYYYFSGYHAVELQFYDGREHRSLESNKLAECPWLDLWYKLHRFSYDQISFSGEMTEKNVDLLVLLSLKSDDSYCKNSFPVDEYWGLQPVYDADFITQQINKHLVVNNVDLTLSKRYNSADNTIAIDTDLLSEGFVMPRMAPPVFKDGYWYVEMRSKSDYDNGLEYDKVYYWIYDDELRIVAFGKDKISAPEKPQAVIKQPTETVISYGDSIILHANATKIPANGYIEWTASNGNFDMKVSADGSTCTISPKKSGDTTFTATICDANGNAVSSDEQVMTSKAGFFNKIIAFFKKLFGMTKVIPQAFKSIF